MQNTLLTLGALLLAIAGIVFAAVTYQQVGPVGRALILLVLTGAAAVAPERLKARSLTASAEALAGVALVLAVLDAWVLRRAGVADDVDGLSYAVVATAVLALVAGAYAVAVPLRVSRIATVLLAQLPVVLLLARTEPSWPVVATTLAALTAADVLVAAERRIPKDVRLTAVLMASGAFAGSLMTSAIAVQQDDRGAGFGFLALAAVLAAGSYRIARPDRARPGFRHCRAAARGRCLGDSPGRPHLDAGAAGTRCRRLAGRDGCRAAPDAPAPGPDRRWRGGPGRRRSSPRAKQS